MAEARGTSRVLGGLAALVILALGLAGCGVSATDRPVDEGDAAAGGSGTSSTVTLLPPTPRDATTPTELVSDFLQAAAGGLVAANDHVKAYLTDNALADWQDPVNPDNPALTVVRIVGGGPTRGNAVGSRTQVTLDYQIVGDLRDLGRIDELVPPETRHLTFWIVPDVRDAASLRIDEIDGWPRGLLLLSDDALTTYYQAEPIYFWDTGHTLLVPDLRYVPLTLSPDQRAGKKVEWLVNGPSPWLSRVERLPSGTKADPVVSEDDGTLQVSLSAEAGAGGQDTLRRLMFQLQWSLANAGGSSRIDLRIGDQPPQVNVGPGEFRDYDHSYRYRGVAPTRYDIRNDDRAVVDGSGTPVALLGSENTDVLSAAIDQQAGVAAVVRTDNLGRSVLQVARTGQQNLLATQAVSAGQLGRPAFVPAGPDPVRAGKPMVLVPANGHLLAVSTEDGSAKDAIPTMSGVTAAAVSPDGRRVAVVAGGDVYVASLAILGDGTLTVGSTPRQVLGGLLDASSVTWTAESWLLAAGTQPGGGGVALWRVSDDGVIARDQSNYAGNLRVDDLVSYPQWNSGAQSNVDVLVATSEGPYAFRGAAPFSPVANLNEPFYGS